MEIKEIKELLNQFDGSSLTEFDLKEGSFELYMNKNKTSRQVVENVVATEAPASNVTAGSQPELASEVVAAAPTTAGEVMTAPIVGIVYLQPSPDQPAFKAVGDSVKKGETVCIIEAMKLLNEITAEFDGTITEILVTNEEVVEYGQPLFKIS